MLNDPDIQIIATGSVVGRYDAARGVFNSMCEKEGEYERSGLATLALWAKGYRIGWEGRTLDMAKSFAKKNLLNWEELLHTN